MSVIASLRSITGLSEQVADLSQSALVLIDCQNTYREGVMKLTGVDEAVGEIQSLLSLAREFKIPIFHVQHDGGPGSPYDIDEPIGAFMDELEPAPGEPVIIKSYPNAFIGTGLEQRLGEAGIVNVVFAGFMTHMCVDSTVRGAFSLGFHPVVVAEATATRDLASHDGSTVPAAEVQRVSLAALADLFAQIVPSALDLLPFSDQ